MSGVVVTDAIDDLIAVVEAGLEDLRAQVTAAEAAADRAEARQRSLEAPDESDRGRAELLRSTLGRMAAMGEAQQDAAILAAEAHAAARVAAARAEADDIMLQACAQLARRLADQRLAALPGPRAGSPAVPFPAPSVAGPARVPPAPTTPVPAWVHHPRERAVVLSPDDDGFATFWRAEVEAELERRDASELNATLIGVVGAVVLLILLLVVIG